MFKKVGLFIFFIVVIALGVYAYTELQQKTIISADLSPRARAYMKQRQGDDGSAWRTVDFNATPKPQRVEIAKSGCFKFTIPFSVKFEREDHDMECAGTYMLDNPRGSIVIFMEPNTNASIDDVSHVKLRRSRSEEYDEYVEKISDKSFVIFKNKNSAFERNAFYLSNGKLLVVNATIYGGEGNEQKFLEMLKSIRFD
jgi:hypothetical protein